MSRRKIAALAVLLLPVLFLCGWMVMYPDPYDPQGIRYVLWKSGLPSMNPDMALEVMEHTNADPIVVGKTEEQLRNRFGYLRTLDQADSYMRSCYANSPWWYGKPVKFLRKSRWMVVFKGDRASRLVLVKGC